MKRQGKWALRVNRDPTFRVFASASSAASRQLVVAFTADHDVLDSPFIASDCVDVALRETNQSSAFPILAVASPNASGPSDPDSKEIQDVTPVPQPLLPDFYPGTYTDFCGLPSNPPCVFKTCGAWPERRDLEAQRILREARPVCDHPIQHVWLQTLSLYRRLCLSVLVF